MLRLSSYPLFRAREILEDLIALGAVLADWPEVLPTRGLILVAERDLIAVLDELFPKEAPGES